MRIIEIESQILNNTKQIREFQKQVSELSKINSDLSQTKEIRLLEMFSDYIELGSTYTFNRYAYLNGVQTGVKNQKIDTISFILPNFTSGDSIEFVKKNKKSFVIKCITKIISKIENPNAVRTKHVTNPNWIFRISIVSLYNNMIKNTEFKSKFDAYVRRKESLELLGI